MDGSAVGRLHQHFDLGVGQLLHVPRRQRRPPLPRVDVLAADGHDGPVVVKAPPLRRTATCPVTMVTQKPEHAGTLATDTWIKGRLATGTLITDWPTAERFRITRRGAPALAAGSTQTGPSEETRPIT